MQRRPINAMGRRLSVERQRLVTALTGLRRPRRRLVLGLIALLAGPLLARLAALLLGPRLRLRLPALLALLLLALAHRSSCRMNSDSSSLTVSLPAGEGRVWFSESIAYMSLRVIPNRPSARFLALPQLSHGLALFDDAHW